MWNAELRTQDPYKKHRPCLHRRLDLIPMGGTCSPAINITSPLPTPCPPEETIQEMRPMKVVEWILTEKWRALR